MLNEDSLKNALQEFIERIDGLETPVGGISLNRRPPRREVILTLITELADRRVLFHPDCLLSYPNSRSDLIGSTEKMRENIKQALVKLAPELEARLYIKNLRDACHHFQTFVERTYISDETVYTDNFRREAIMKLRGTFGINLAALVRLYSVPIDENLTRIIPNGMLMLDG